MTETEKSIEKPENTNQSTKSLLDHPLIKEFGIPLAKQALKKELGIGIHDKDLTKKPFGRGMMAMKDFIQGTWYIIVLFFLSMGGSLLILKWIAKYLGV